MTQPTHTPTGTFPDLDGSGLVGPLQIQATGEVFSSAILIKSANGNMGLMCKLIDACDWLNKNASVPLASLITNLAKQTASSGDTLIGALTYAGTSLTLPTGTLRAVLAYIADNAAKISGNNSFTGTNTFTGFGGTLSSAIVTRSSTISPGAGVILDVAVESYIWATPTAQQDVEVSFTSTVPRIGSTIWLTRPSTGAFSIIVHREGQAAAIVTLPSSTECGALLAWVGNGAGSGRWRLAYSTTGATPGADA